MYSPTSFDGSLPYYTWKILCVCFFFLNKLSSSTLSVCVIFPKASADLVSLYHILVILAIFQAFL